MIDRHLTSDEAVALGKAEFWKDMSPRDAALFQFFQEYLCFPDFGVFQEVVTKALGRSVWTHEFSHQGPRSEHPLLKELLGERPAPTFEQIMELIPADKRIIVLVGANKPSNWSTDGTGAGVSTEQA